MSSLAATQADGYYVPPEYYESGAYRKLTRNQWSAQQQQQQHIKRGKATKDVGNNAPVVRFELPSSAICQSCGSYISKGTRFNAQKRKTGDFYFSTPILEFEMTSRCCAKTQFFVRTNPQQRGFDYVTGLQKLNKDGKNRSTLEGKPNCVNKEEEEEVEDALSHLENAARGQRKTMSEIEQLKELQQFKEKHFRQDSDANSSIRKIYREERKCNKKRRRDAEALGFREGIILADHEPSEAERARKMTFGNSHISEKERFLKARSSSIFSNSRQKPSKSSHTVLPRVRDKQSLPCEPDRVTSSSSDLIVSRSPALGNRGSTKSGQKKKIDVTKISDGKSFIVSANKTTATSPTPSSWSALDALADYGSDSD